MKRGFTLLELMVVIIIIGVLATIGLTQYQTVTERSRGAEARQILGALRSQCAALYIADNDATDCTNEMLGVGTGDDQVPSDCSKASHYFYYTAAPDAGGNQVTFTATRCDSGGKAPAAPVAGRYLSLTTDYSTGGTDTWASNFGY